MTYAVKSHSADLCDGCTVPTGYKRIYTHIDHSTQPVKVSS